MFLANGASLSQDVRFGVLDPCMHGYLLGVIASREFDGQLERVPLLPRDTTTTFHSSIKYQKAISGGVGGGNHGLPGKNRPWSDLSTELQSGVSRHQLAAIWESGSRRDAGAEVVDALLKLLVAQNPILRSEAALALGHQEIEEDKIRRTLLECLHSDSNEEARSHIAIALGTVVSRMRSTEHQDGEVKEELLRVISSTPHRQLRDAGH